MTKSKETPAGNKRGVTSRHLGGKKNFCIFASVYKPPPASIPAESCMQVLWTTLPRNFERKNKII